MNLPHPLNRHIPPAPSGDTGFNDCANTKSVERVDGEFDGSDSHFASLPVAAPAWQSSTRYADQPMNWSTRLFGMGGVTTIMLAIVGGALFTWRTYTAPPAVPTLSVFDVAPPAAPPEPPSEIPPGLEQKQKPLPVPDRPKIEPPEIQPPSVSPLALPVPQPVSDPGPPVERATAPERQPAPPAPQVSMGKPTWEGMVLAALNKAKRYPREAQRTRQQGIPYIRFVMDREGRVLSVRLERSSGVGILDKEALALPKRASPLPKPPEGVGTETIELVVPIEFFLR